MRLFTLAIFVAFTTLARADLAISIRYFKIKGTSHYHLYLYSDDGKVIRQLTAPEDAQDTAPMFSTDGSEIYFTREQRETKQLYSIHPDGTQLRVVEKAPEGYPPTNADTAYKLEGGGDNDPLWQARGEDLFLETPDKKQELLLKSADNFQRQDPIYEAICFKALTLRDTAGGKAVRISTALDKDDNYCDFATRQKSPFLILPEFRVLFYWQWQGSTDGPRLGVLDLAAKRALFVSQNPAIAIPHGTRPGFFCVCEDRYQPLGQTSHTVNCLYLDWWNAKLQRTRFAKAISLFGGASVRVKDQPQLDISGKD